MKLSRLKLPAIGLVVLLATILVAAVHSTPAHAAGETFTWKNYRTITVSGGDLKGPADCKFVDNAQLTGDQEAKYVCTVMYKPDNCELTFGLYTYKTSTKQGYTWAPAGIIPVPPVISAPGSPITCSSKLNNYNDQLKYHDKWVDLQGTRPTNPNVPETPDQQTYRVIVLAPDPLSKVPASDTIYIYTGDGKTKVKELTASPFKDDSGMADWPPDQTPASLQTVFQGLEPGDYIVCDNYAAKNCTDPSKLTDGQKITKKKYDGTGGTTIGKQFETPDKKRIRGHVEYHVKAPCGSTVSVSPVTIELTGPDGKTYDQQTNAGTAKPGGNENGALCTKDVALGLYAEWNDMPDGQYKACATGAECITITKNPGEGVDDFTLVVNGEQQAPPDQKVCTSGDGIAGALAWIICPATELIAKATDFFENNIIIPFLTVSPLTTANDNPIYIMWKDFRDFANVGFIILLFISIFSIALSKYGLMKVLPRLLIVAVGINLSYFVVAFVIDAFNIFGAGVAQLVTAALHQAGTTQLNDGTSAGPVRSLFTLGGAALIAILLSGGAALGWLFSFLGLAALVIVVVVIVLIIRQIGIITLVMISPIAILMYMLPNTEGYFKKWRQTLIQLLMMYPMIVLLFAAGKIFGVVLQQPDFKITGDGVSDEVAQGVRVILQFLVYVIPLAFLPATFAASGGLMSRIYGGLHKRAVQPRANRLKEDAAHMANEAKLRTANSRVPGLNKLAGRGLRRDYVRATRDRNLQREQEEYLAGAVSGSSFLRRQAAGVSGQAGQTRAAASAARAAEKGRHEDIEAEEALLNQEMRRLSMDEDTFAERVAEYLENPTNPAHRVITGANGQTFDFAANETRLQRALLNSAASQGYIRAVEAARMNSNIDQNMVDDIIRQNDGKLKEKGGYHLATNFNLAAGRIQVHDPGTGAMRAPANRDEAEAEIKARRLVAMAQTGSNSIAGMKASLLSDSGTLLATTGAQRTAVLKIMDQISAEDTAKTGQAVNYRTMLHGKMDMILNPAAAQTLARSDADRSVFENIRNGV